MTCGFCSHTDCDGNTRCKKCPNGWGGEHCDIPVCKDFNICGEHGIYTSYQVYVRPMGKIGHAPVNLVGGEIIARKCFVIISTADMVF